MSGFGKFPRAARRTVCGRVRPNRSPPHSAGIDPLRPYAVLECRRSANEAGQYWI